MKNLIKLFMVMAVLCIVACSQTFEDISNNEKPQEKTQGRLVMNMGNQSRTIMPTIAENDIKSATLTANDIEIGSWSDYNVIGQIESDNSILLDVGIYNFEMVFCNENNDVILIGTINNQEIKNGNNSLTFDMQIPTTGKGNIVIELSWKTDSGINKIKAGLYHIATGETVENYEMEELTINKLKSTYSKNDIPSGQYIIKFEVYDTSDKLLNTLTDVIEVIGGITTTDKKVLNKINTQYTITYNLDGGNWKNGFTPVTERNANTKITLPTAEDIEKENSILAGWYDNYGNIITQIPSGTTENITVIAGWKTTADTVAATITALSQYYIHYIIVTGAITTDTISAIKTALQNNSYAYVNLDLSGTTGLTTLSNNAFSYCDNLMSMTIPDSVTSIGNGAFRYCNNLTSVTIPDSVTSIGKYAFENCYCLKNVYISDIAAWCNIDFNTDYASYSNPFNFADNLYLNGSLVTDLVIPDSVTSIGDDAFSNCDSLTSVTIPDSVTSIGDYAFSYCNNLMSMTIPDSVTSIGDGAFGSCHGLTSVTIGNGVTTISEQAFSACDGLTSVVIPDSVTSIGSHAFEYCHSLTSVVIPDSVTSIDDGAFYGCDGLTSVTIPDSVTSISDEAFYACDGLTSVTIPDSVTSIGDGAFSSCDSLTKFNVDTNNTSFSSSDDGKILYSKDKTALIAYPSAIGEITILDGITSINNSVFSGCYRLTNVTIPDSVTSIGDYAFSYCNNLMSMTIPDSVTSIGDSAFNYCYGLTSVTIGNSVTSIGKYAFQDCNNLTSVTIGNSVTTIGDQVFCRCSNLTSVVIPDSVTSIGDYAFSVCSSLTTVNYKGTQEQWEQISINSGNGYLTDATINYNYTE